MIEKQIELIKIQIEKLEHSDFDLKAWKSSTIIILGRIFGETYNGIKAIENIKYSSSGVYTATTSSTWNNMKSCKNQGKAILEACITELEIFGKPDKKQVDSSGISINLTQNQNQTVNINLLISALEEELTVSQLREVNDIMKSEGPKTEKKGKIINKIKSFGGDVASNILANILTNPNIWG